ncbi:porin family protein [Dokdonia sp. Hel_I_53]|uniref:porin family protein n=1 Tax=Dokdonia sp. Hel_I_53 TaxID=1566287 RepID=UPI00119B0604|nr:porin family protein [Dokdonia sp. Hel_I_53]TVZ51852.1 outer membrane protein with beta-barrel domain [Dokdonia sp. Hel_I_53]
MKKIVLAVVALLGVVTVQAQDEVSFGVKGGVNFAKLQGDDVEDADGRTGFHLGAIVEIPVTEKFSVQPEVMYSQQGLQSEFEDGNTTSESKLKLDYINVPILGKYYVAEGLSLEAGPQFGFRAKAEQEFESSTTSGGVTVESEGTENIEDSIAGFDMGAAIGAGYELNTGLFFQARYVIGLSNVDDSDEGGLFEDDLTNSNLQFSVGFKF